MYENEIKILEHETPADLSEWTTALRTAIALMCAAEPKDEAAELAACQAYAAEITCCAEEQKRICLIVAQARAAVRAECAEQLAQEQRGYAYQKQLVEPNPHPEGSYMWAYEEAQRGREVTRKDTHWSFSRPESFEMGELNHADFIATDWEHV